VQPDPILAVEPLAFPWPGFDPFLFVAFHEDDYPAGDELLRPRASLTGRDLGMDFAGKDGWRMYHGHEVPGFPQHPHRGFETVTIVRRGLVDHSDSLGATARFGAGDVQWVTAGQGIVHSEMFPLVEQEQRNPLELFQIWLNLPASSKHVAPFFSMLWRERIPVVRPADGVEVTLVAGGLEGARPPAPPPGSFASDPTADLAIWTLQLSAGARWRLPAAAPATKRGTQRALYLFRGEGLQLGGRILKGRSVARLTGESIALEAGASGCELLMLQGRPLDEPVVAHGPFVMNSAAEIHQAFADYQRTRFGGWPWPSDGPVHPRGVGRFARAPGGQIERPE